MTTVVTAPAQGDQAAPTTGPSATQPGAHQPTVVALVAHARRVPSVQREAFAAELATLEPSPGVLVIHTCHRVELYLTPRSSGELALPGIPAGTERLEDVDAARHLIAVACGLDSAVFGEDQILHQLRETLAARQAGHPLDPVLDRLFQIALRAGRQARTWLDGSPRSLADLALDRIGRDAGSLEGRTILVAGVGRMGRLAAFAAARRGARIVVTNRTASRATALAGEVGGRALPFAVDGGLPELDGVVVALGGAWPLGPADARRLLDGRAVVVDLSSPPAVPDGLRTALGARFVSVDDLVAGPEQGPQERLRRRLEDLVTDAGREYCDWLRRRSAVPAIQAMTDTAEELRRSELERLFRRLSDLPAEDRSVIEQMSHRLVAGILHAPLRALNSDPDGELEAAARELFGL
ncbi:MAG: hypothetical protein ACOYXS_01320 [Chloroflexota bacterium]